MKKLAFAFLSFVLLASCNDNSERYYDPLPPTVACQVNGQNVYYVARGWHSKSVEYTFSNVPPRTDELKEAGLEEYACLSFPLCRDKRALWDVHFYFSPDELISGETEVTLDPVLFSFTVHGTDHTVWTRQARLELKLVPSGEPHSAGTVVRGLFSAVCSMDGAEYQLTNGRLPKVVWQYTER